MDSAERLTLRYKCVRMVSLSPIQQLMLFVSKQMYITESSITKAQAIHISSLQLCYLQATRAMPPHKRYGPDGEVVHEWTQRALAVSRVMQVWRDVIVRNRLLEDEASSPYLQRKHCVLKDTGYARAAAACAREPKGIPASVQEKMKEAFDNA